MTNREKADRFCELGILGVVLTILVLGPLALGGVRSLEFSIIQGLTVCAGLLWAVRLWLDPRAQLLWPPICWAVLAFTGYAVARYFTADVEYIARQELLRVLVYALLFFAILNNLHRQESTTVISFSVVFLALAIAGYGLYQYLAESDLVWGMVKPYHHRASGTYFCPNHLGGFLEMLLPIALAYTLTGRVKAVTRVFLGYAAAVILAGIAATVSRGAWLSTAVAILVLVGCLVFRRAHRLPAVLLLVLVIGSGAVFVKKSYFGQQRIKELVTPEGQVNDDLRFSLWRPAFQMWQEHPWWGVGPGHFDVRFREYRPEGIQLKPDRVHNDYLNTLADWGLAGACLVASAWLLLGIGVFKTWRAPRLASADLGPKTTSNKYAFLLGGSVGLLAILVHSWVDFNMQIPANAILAVTLMALLSGHTRFATDRFWVRASALLKGAVTVGLLGAAVYLVPQAWRLGSEFVWLSRAARAQSYSVDQIKLLQRAHEIEPANPQTAYEIAESYRRQSQEGGQFYEGQEGVNYRTLCERAITWFKRGMTLNRFDSRNFAGIGWCLDWLDRQNESAPWFEKAEQLDPNNYFNLNNIALHYVQEGNYAAAKPWFERSLRLEWPENHIARNYLRIIQARLMEDSTNSFKLPPGASTP